MTQKMSKKKVPERKIRYMHPHLTEAGFGTTFSEMADHCRKSDLYKLGDAVLVWVNEGDLCVLGEMMREELNDESK